MMNNYNTFDLAVFVSLTADLVDLCEFWVEVTSITAEHDHVIESGVVSTSLWVFHPCLEATDSFSWTRRAPVAPVAPVAHAARKGTPQLITSTAPKTGTFRWTILRTVIVPSHDHLQQHDCQSDLKLLGGEPETLNCKKSQIKKMV